MREGNNNARRVNRSVASLLVFATAAVLLVADPFLAFGQVNQEPPRGGNRVSNEETGVEFGVKRGCESVAAAQSFSAQCSEAYNTLSELPQ